MLVSSYNLAYIPSPILPSLFDSFCTTPQDYLINCLNVSNDSLGASIISPSTRIRAPISFQAISERLTLVYSDRDVEKCRSLDLVFEARKFIMWMQSNGRLYFSGLYKVREPIIINATIQLHRREVHVKSQ